MANKADSFSRRTARLADELDRTVVCPRFATGMSTTNCGLRMWSARMANKADSLSRRTGRQAYELEETVVCPWFFWFFAWFFRWFLRPADELAETAVCTCLHILLLSTCLVLSFAAKAACDNIANLQTKTIFIDIGDGCGDQTLIRFGNMKSDGSIDESSEKEFPFYKECVLLHGKNGYDTGFSCRAKGNTPLAGATYTRVKHGKSQNNCAEDKAPGSRYVCIRGCDKASVPKYLVGYDGSC